MNNAVTKILHYQSRSQSFVVFGAKSSSHLVLFRAFGGGSCAGSLSLHLAPSRVDAAGCRRARQRIGQAAGTHCARGKTAQLQSVQ